jgi:putative molybdopterin biosynthesis protein
MLITTKEVAALLRVHPKQVYRLLKRGLPAHRVGDEWRFDKAEVLGWGRGAPGDPAQASSSSSSSALSVGDAPPLLAGNGDAPVELLLEELRQLGAPLLGFVQADHATGLDLLDRGAVLLAGCHGEAAPSEAARGKLAWIHLVTRELGLAFRRGMRSRRVSSIVGRRFANRPPTAGIRLRLDEALRRDGVDLDEAYAHATLYRSHREAVMAVVRGEAEMGLASRGWASRAGLGFLPLVAEGYGLLLHAEALGDPRVVALCEVAQGAAFRRRLADESGYESQRAGEIRFGARGSSRG